MSENKISSWSVQMLYIYQKELEAWQNKFIPPLANEIYKFFVDIFNNALTTVRKEKNLKIDSAEETRETFIEFIHKLDNDKLKTVPALEVKKIIKKVTAKLGNGLHFQVILNLLFRLEFKTQMSICSNTQENTKSTLTYMPDDNFVLLLLFTCNRNIVLKYPHLFNPRESPSKLSVNRLEAFKLIRENIQNAFMDELPLKDIFKKQPKKIQPDYEASPTEKFIADDLDDKTKKFIKKQTEDIAKVNSISKKVSQDSQKWIDELAKIQEQNQKLEEQNRKTEIQNARLIQEFENIQKTLNQRNQAQQQPTLPQFQPQVPLKYETQSVAKPNIQPTVKPTMVYIPPKPAETKPPSNIAVLPLTKEALQLQSTAKNGIVQKIPENVQVKQNIIQYSPIQANPKTPPIPNITSTQKPMVQEPKMNDTIQSLKNEKPTQLKSKSKSKEDEGNESEDGDEGDGEDDGEEGFEEDYSDSEEEENGSVLSSASKHVEVTNKN